MVPIIVDVSDAYLMSSILYDQLDVNDFDLTLNIDSSKRNVGISSFYINRISAFFLRFKKKNEENRSISGIIRIRLSNKFETFDISLISAIAIFKANFENIFFEIKLGTDLPTGIFIRFRDVLFSLREWYKSLYNISLFTFENESNLNTNSVKEPEGVFPIILITPKTFNEYFVLNNEKSISLSDLFTENTNQIVNDLKSNLEKYYADTGSYASKNFRAIRDTLKNNENNIKWHNTNRIFFQHYLKILCEFDLVGEQIQDISIQLNEEIKIEAFRKGGTSALEMSLIKKSVRNVLIKLRSHPPLLTLIYSVLLSRNLEKNIDNIDKYVLKVEELFEFSRNLFLGLKELARNVIEHTTSKLGFFSARIYDSNALTKLKCQKEDEVISAMIEEYYSYLSKKGYFVKNETDQFFLDVILFDEGHQGIVNKAIENIEVLSSKDVNNNLYLDDIELLRNGKIVFGDFFNPTEVKLHHHAIKASSHWGLIVFTSLINRNNGLFLASSYSNKADIAFDSCYKYGNSIFINDPVNPNFEIGSYYNIILPLDKTFNLKDNYLANTVPKDSDFPEQNFKELLKYKYIYDVERIRDDGSKDLLSVKLSDFIPPDKLDEYRLENIVAQLLAAYLIRIGTKQRKVIPVIDFENCETLFDQSKLIRFFAELQMGVDINSFIVLNIPKDFVQHLFETLAMPLFNQSGDIGTKSFWNKEHFILIYSYDVGNSATRVYYADLLGGHTYDDFLSLNSKILATHFTKRKFPKDYPAMPLTKETSESLRNSPLYISETGVIQNFELIIEHYNETLFEMSINYILNQEV